MVVYKVVSKTSRQAWASLREAAWMRVCMSNNYMKGQRNFRLAICISVGCQFQVTLGRAETISISYLVRTCNQTSNESPGRLLGGLAIGISSPETVPRVCATFPHRFDWVVKRLKKIIPLKNPHTHYWWRLGRIFPVDGELWVLV